MVAASLLDLQGAGRAGFLTSVLIAITVTTLVQAGIGHRLPLFEGPSTPYLAMLVLLVQAAPATPALRAQLAFSLILSGVAICIVSWFWAPAIARLVGPYVVGSFLFLLGVTLLLRLAPQAVGHTATRSYDRAAVVALLAVLAASLLVSRVGPPILRALIFLNGYLVGLGAFLLAGGSFPVTRAGGDLVVLPDIGPLATPDPGLGVLVVLTMLIPLVNVYASIGAVQAAMRSAPHPDPPPQGREIRVNLRAATLLYGGSQVVAGLLGSMGTVPRSESSGLVAASGSGSRRPLMIAGGALLVVAVLGPAVARLASFPVAVATDVLLVAVVFVTLIALRLYRQVRWTRSRAFATAAGLGLCLALTVTSAGWGAAGVFLTNPILPGTLLAIAIDQALRGRGAQRA